MLDRLQEVSAQVFEAAAKRRVEREFEIARQRGARKAPITGDNLRRRIAGTAGRTGKSCGPGAARQKVVRG